MSEHRLRRGLVSRPETLGLRPHPIRTGQQTIVVTIPRKPAEVGIDPYSC